LHILRWLFRAVPIRNTRYLAWRDHLLTKLGAEIHHFRESLTHITQEKKGSLAIAMGMTGFLFFNKYLIGYVIARMLGQDVEFAVLIGLLIIQLFLIYFAPTPGASGVAEITSVWLMGKIMPGQVLLLFALLWRMVTTILGAILGGIILLSDMRQWIRGNSLSPGEDIGPVDAHTAVHPSEET
jgi:hypothetical protein